MYLPALPPDGDMTELSRLAGDPLRWAFVTGVRLLRMQRASLLLWDDTEAALLVAASVGMPPATAEEVRIKLGQGFAGTALEREMVLFGQAADGDFLCVPLPGRDTFSGVLNLTHPSDDRALGENDIVAARALADHLAQVLPRCPDTGADLVSGLPTERAFAEIAERELARAARIGSPLVLAVIRMSSDIVSSPNLNGRTATVATQSIANRLRAMIRQYDILARCGNDDLILLLPHTRTMNGSLTQRLSESVAGVEEEVAVGLPVQVGLACCPADGVTLGDLLARARSRLQVLHAAGENRH